MYIIYRWQIFICIVDSAFLNIYSHQIKGVGLHHNTAKVLQTILRFYLYLAL